MKKIILYCKLRINVTQIKVGMTMYYFNNIYREREREEEIKEKCWENERKRGREFLSFSRDAPYMGCKKHFIGFRIWTPITHLKDE